MLTLEYIGFVFAAACGVLQLAAARSQLKGLMFFESRFAACLFGAIAIGMAYAWFFSWKDRNQLGLEGAQQFGYFVTAALLALLFSLGLSSAIKAGKLPGSARAQGLDALKEMTYFQAIAHRFRRKR